MKKFTLLLILSFFIIAAFAQQEQYSKAKIFLGENGLQLLAQLGIDVTEGSLKKGEFFISDFSTSELLKIQDLGLNYEVMIPDVAKYYADRNDGLSKNVGDYKGAGDYEVPENFEFGSMGGHDTYDEMVANLDNMHTLFPDLITEKESIGQTIEGRDLWMVKISDNPNVNETEPEVLYTALHHAREPEGMMQMLFYMYYLLENYENDPFIQTLVDNTEMYFVPCINPDGYVYNQTTSPNGGGMWRKNRRDNGGGIYGVDINRNYGYMWGLDNYGSSPDPSSETYRGTAAFSEPETSAIRDFCESHIFVNILNYHTFSNDLLYEWGYTADPSPDDAIFHAHSVLMTQDNHYLYGPGYTTIYPTNGGSDDWMYGEQITKNKSFSYTSELGGSSDGFWCPVNRIIPIAQENMIQNILIAAFAGSYADVEEVNPTITDQTSGYFKFDITRLGLKDGATFTVSLDPIGTNVTSTGNPVIFSDMDILETRNDSIFYTLDPAILNGHEFKFLLSVDNGDYALSDTVTKIFGETNVLFEDDCNTFTNWTSSEWAVTTSSYHSPGGSITDSPSGNYPNNHTSTATFNNTIDLGNAGFAILQFWTKWALEPGFDYVQLQISTNGGSSWTALTGKYTMIGNDNQATGEPVYNGMQTDWVQEEVNLSDYIGTTVKFRFRLKSDWSVNEDGFYFDDFTITTVNMEYTGIQPGSVQQSVFLSEPFPNPANESVTVRFTIPETSKNVNFNLVNSTGQVVYSSILKQSQHGLSVSLTNFESGIYYYRIEGNNFQSEVRKLIVIH